MKKILSAVVAVALSMAMFTSMAYVATPEKSSESQIKLVSIKAVDIQTAITGVRSYSELTDTTRGYQVNDAIYLATTVEVRNLEKEAYRNLKSIKDKDIAVIVGSENIDLSYSKYTNPILLSHIYSGINDTAIATMADIINVSNVLDYDKDKNEVKFIFRGYEQNSASWLTGFSAANLSRVYLSAYIWDGKIMIPALRAKDGKNTVVLGNNTYNYSWDAPSSMAYTVVLTGVTKDNAGAQTGSYYAQIEITGAEKFVDDGDYYIDVNGKQFKRETLEKGGVNEAWVEYVDYLKVHVRKLEVANAYNVYKYEIPSSGMIDTVIPVLYVGSNGDYGTTSNSYTGLQLAAANPNRFDYATDKTDKTTVNVAGGVRKIEAWTGYTYNATTRSFSRSAKADVPLTSVIYTEFATVYAGAYYGISTTTGNFNVVQLKSSDFKPYTGSATEMVNTVDYWTYVVNVPDPSPAMWPNVTSGLTVADAFTPALTVYPTAVTPYTAGSITINGGTTYQPQPDGSRTYTVQVVPTPKTLFPAGTTASAQQQQWTVAYAAPAGITLISGPTETVSMKPVAKTQTGILVTFADATGKAVDLTQLANDKTVSWDTLTAVWNDVAAASELANQPAMTAAGFAWLAPAASPITNHGMANGDADMIAKALTDKKIVNGALLIPVTTSGSVTTWANAAGQQSWAYISGATPASAVVYPAGKAPTQLGWAQQSYSNTPTLAAGPLSWNSTFTMSLGVPAGASYTQTAIRMSDYDIAHIVADDAHNGIAVYVITKSKDDKPLVAVATEDTYFESEDGYGICLFDAMNLGNLGTRISRASDANMVYSTGASHVKDGDVIITALQFFGLDTSFNTTYRITEKTFEAKGAAAAYSEKVVGTFNYGTLTLVAEAIEEGTNDEVIDDTDVVPDDTVPADTTPEVAPVTGDSSANIAIALAAAAIVAAAGLAFVMKKVR